MALIDTQESCQPETNKETMHEVIDAMFNGIANKYSQKFDIEGLQYKADAKETCAWKKYEAPGRWGSDVEFMFFADGYAFYVSGTRHMYEIDDELKGDDWGWMDGHNWICRWAYATDEEGTPSLLKFNQLVKEMNKYGETPSHVSIKNFDMPWDFTQELQGDTLLWSHKH